MGQEELFNTASCANDIFTATISADLKRNVSPGLVDTIGKMEIDASIQGPPASIPEDAFDEADDSSDQSPATSPLHISDPKPSAPRRKTTRQSKNSEPTPRKSQPKTPKKKVPDPKAEALLKKKCENAQKWRQTQKALRERLPKLEAEVELFKRKNEALETEVMLKNMKMEELELQIRDLHRKNGSLLATCDVLQQRLLSIHPPLMPNMTTYTTLS
ncbi:unnamed protein product, partial [Mesorhabditis spiculigera]